MRGWFRYCIQSGSGDLSAARSSKGRKKVRVMIARRLDSGSCNIGEAGRPAENTWQELSKFQKPQTRESLSP